jgi:hypothetical protein
MTPRALRKPGNGILWVVICFAVTVTNVASPQRRKPAPAKKVRVDYSRFSHLTEPHRATCNSCHTFPSKNWKQVRKGDDAFADVTEYPEHQACLQCHRQQFFARERPVPTICSNCHVKATPSDTSRLPFPSLREAFLATATLFPTFAWLSRTINTLMQVVKTAIKPRSRRRERSRRGH